ncbi:MAG: ComF family protein [Candidatus Lernaella stagnicola]|nr:ComF family protein [Candidatus Lernaella stagnicola]
MLDTLLTTRVPLWRRLRRGAVRMVFPDLCPWCRRPLAPGDSFLGCAACLERIDLIREPYCHRCGLPVEKAVMPFTCSRCLEDPPHFDRLRGVVVYEGVVATAIQKLKYERNLSAVHALARVLYHVADLGLRWHRYDAVVPVPLFPKRYRQRWFNQSIILTTALPNAEHLVLRPGWLRRVRDTPRQATLTQTQRRQNLKGAFAAKADMSGLKILLVDDVSTTGATIDECAKACKSAGAAIVDAACVARATV